MNSPSASKPLSPPHSTDDDVGRSDTKRNIIKQPPCTPPQGSNQLLQSIPSAHRFLDQYEDPSMYQIAPFQTYHLQQPTFVRTMQNHTTPSDVRETAALTGTKRMLGSPIHPRNAASSRRSKSPKQKRAPRSRTGKVNSPVIHQPLSILTKDYQNPVRDMAAWVNRPVQERLEEVEKKKGYIARPMNSFMLYRSAYAERVKQFCKENNHQVVSQVTGASWPLEPKEIRQMYEQYAIIERDNHQAAHPQYKFAPNKNVKRRTQVGENDESDEDPDWEGSTRSAKRSRSSRQAESRSRTGTPSQYDELQQYRMPQYQPAQYHPSSYQFNNPHGPAPMLVGGNGINHYYQTSVVPYDQQVDDVKFGKLDDTFAQFDMNMSLVGMPDTQAHDMLAMQPPSTALEVTGQANNLDPRLDHQESNYQYMQQQGFDQQYGTPRNFEYPAYPAQQQIIYADQAYHPGMNTLTEAQLPWSEMEHPGAVFDREFRKWS